MHSVKRTLFLLLTVTSMVTAPGDVRAADLAADSYEAVRRDPSHFKPAIDTASDDQCLGCHQEILDRTVLEQSPAGVAASEALAWYQTLDTYEGPQETFHRRHLATPLAKRVMDMKCNTCHQGHDPREEAPIPPTSDDAGFTLRKVVNPKTCLMCHGQFEYQLMGLPGPWLEVSETFGDSCLTCHVAIRTHRHQVNFLNAEAIEQAGQEDADVCFGCHGGRAWYRISFPYPRHSWPGIADQVPDWAKDRPTESEARFLSGVSAAPDAPAQ
jgi:nitrate/TMAO reductase-like tetraheme cytochrome c subunit